MLWGYVYKTKKWEVHVIDFADIISRRCESKYYKQSTCLIYIHIQQPPVCKIRIMANQPTIFSNLLLHLHDISFILNFPKLSCTILAFDFASFVQIMV